MLVMKIPEIYIYIYIFFTIENRFIFQKSMKPPPTSPSKAHKKISPPGGLKEYLRYVARGKRGVKCKCKKEKNRKVTKRYISTRQRMLKSLCLSANKTFSCIACLVAPFTFHYSRKREEWESAVNWKEIIASNRFHLSTHMSSYLKNTKFKVTKTDRRETAY